MAFAKFFKGKGGQDGTTQSTQAAPVSTRKPMPPPDSKSKPAKRKSIGQRMVERAGY